MERRWGWVTERGGPEEGLDDCVGDTSGSLDVRPKFRWAGRLSLWELVTH